MSLKLRSENRMRPSKHFLCGSQQPFNKISSVASPNIWGETVNTIFFGIPPIKAQRLYILKIRGNDPIGPCLRL